MKRAFVFPGQGAQFPGMGKELYAISATARKLFDEANDILGFSLTDVMFDGTVEELKQTNVTQPAIFVHSVAAAFASEEFTPDMVAGHSLGEFSALVAAKGLAFADGLKLVAARAAAMQKACERQPSTMAAVLGLFDEIVEAACASVEDEIVVPANYNSPGQVVISGTIRGVELATEKLKEAGAKRVIILPVSGAFHSPLMESARHELATAMENAQFSTPECPLFQNVNAEGSVDPAAIKANLLTQLTAPVRWTQSIQKMMEQGATNFTECGPGKVLQGLIKKIEPTVEVYSL